MCKCRDNLLDHCLHAVICVLLWSPRNLDRDWLLCWTLTYSNCVAPSAATWKSKTLRNTGLNQRSCWTNWPTFTYSWIVLALLKQLLMIRWAPKGWEGRAQALWTKRNVQSPLEDWICRILQKILTHTQFLSQIPAISLLSADHLCSCPVCSP